MGKQKIILVVAHQNCCVRQQFVSLRKLPFLEGYGALSRDLLVSFSAPFESGIVKKEQVAGFSGVYIKHTHRSVHTA